MAEPRMRICEPQDDKLVRWIVGKAGGDELACANRRAILHPLTFTLWTGLSAVLVQFMGWWPDPDAHGVLGYLSPIPAFAVVAVPIIAGIDWFNRPSIEEAARRPLHAPDLRDEHPSSYYSRESALSEGSGLWILETGGTGDKAGRLIGIVAIDMSPPEDKAEKGLARLRHLYVEEPYRQTGIQHDLLRHALQQARDNKRVELVRTRSCALTPYLPPALHEAGFRPRKDKDVEHLGVWRWPAKEVELRIGADC